MAVNKPPYGKDRVVQSSEGFISHALTGGSGVSSGIVDYPVDRPSQTIKTAFPPDNVKLAMPIDTSLRDTSFPGGDSNLKHSLTGASAVNEEVGAAGALKHVIIPNHAPAWR
jgi:hypothetical protein